MMKFTPANSLRLETGHPPVSASCALVGLLDDDFFFLDFLDNHTRAAIRGEAPRAARRAILS